MQMKNTVKLFATAALLAGFVGSSVQAATVVYNDSTGSYTSYDASSPFSSTFTPLTGQNPNGTTGETDVSVDDFQGLTSAVAPGAGYFFLEDFEDGQLDSPGLSFNANGIVRTKLGINGSQAKATASGVVSDGATLGGFRFNGGKVTWTFDSAALGGNLPTYFGFAFPETFNGVNDYADLVVAYDSDDNVIGTIDNTAGVTPSDVPFYGFQTDVGIAYVEITMNSAGEADHFQYGYAVPEPGSLALLGLGGLLVASRRRRDA